MLTLLIVVFFIGLVAGTCGGVLILALFLSRRLRTEALRAQHQGDAIELARQSFRPQPHPISIPPEP